MIIRTLWITRKSEEAPPELIEAWDEWSIEDNFEGWTRACEEALERIGNDVDQFRYIDIDLGSQIESRFLTEVAVGKVETE